MKKFYIGTDIGTNSVGIACTDENYNLLRAKGKDCWAVRLFEEGETAAKRRGFRTARRRLARRKQRIAWLQELFAPFIEDKTFFIRLNNSQYLPEDKDELLFSDKDNLFAGKYDDKKFHKDNPTIYHLRKKLVDGGDYDLRLYYLALHHIIKYRGHFLFEGGMDDIRDFKRLLSELNEVIEDLNLTDESEKDDTVNKVEGFDLTKADDAKKILLSRDTGIKDKQLKLFELFSESGKIQKEIIKGITGGKISPATLFGEELKEEKGFSFKEITDEEFEAMKLTYGDNFALLEKMRSVYCFVTFERLLEGHPDISSAMIAVYDKHKADLKKLKDFIKNEFPQENCDAESNKEFKKIYNNIFKDTDQKANYVNYIGYTKKGGKKINVKKCKDKDFFDYLKKKLSDIPNVKDELVRDEIKKELDNGTFLPKILHSDNGLFPRQINEAELEKIVANMVKNHPETKAFADKIVKLFEFRIPYYVGPLTGDKSGDGSKNKSWVVRTDEKITAENFDRVFADENGIVDRAKSNEEFMRRMTNKCTYLRGEDVLPKASIMYQKYDTLNQLNKLKINDVPIPVELKKKIFDELFLTYPKVTDKKIKEFLVKEGLFSPGDEKNIVLTGKDGDFKASMSSYIRLKKILGDFVDKDIKSSGGVCENIILWHTLNTDKNIVKGLIDKNYSHIPEIKAAIPQLKGLTFNDFGRFSAKFLSGIEGVNKETGECMTILKALYETNENLNELLFDDNFDFGTRIEKANGGNDTEITYEDVEELYVSPAVRRGIWQTLLMIDEYVAAVGRVPDKIFVEVTREDGKKGDEGRTKSRKNQLKEKYKNIDAAYADIKAALEDEKYTDLRLRQERLYLYFRQLGRCMYTGARIDLENLNTDTYDVDHILPRTYIKDDSLDNKVLVLRTKNAQKSDTYPLPAGFVGKDQYDFWKMLLSKELISRTTYDRLIRTKPLSDDDYKDFISRQKVITDQTAKAVIELLKRKYPDTKIVFSKAIDVSDFRKKFKLFKCRETNDLHHARDAYLNVVVGNVYSTVFPAQERYYNDGTGWHRYNLDKMFTRNVTGAWDTENSIKIAKRTLEKPSMMVTRYASCEKGGFYNQTVCGKNDKSVTAPRKGKGPLADTSKYGGYNTQTTAYFSIVSSTDENDKKIKTIEAIPVLTSYMAKSDPEAVQKYLATYLKDPDFLLSKVKKYQLVSYNNTLCYIAAITGNYIIAYNANQLFTDNKTDEYVRELVKILKLNDKNMIKKDESEYPTKVNSKEGKKLSVTAEMNIKFYRYLKDKMNDKIFAGISTFKKFSKALAKGEEAFISLSTLDQSKVLLQILKFLKCNGDTADTRLIGGSGRSGTICLNKDITDVDFKLIDFSPAGLTERIRRV